MLKKRNLSGHRESEMVFVELWGACCYLLPASGLSVIFSAFLSDFMGWFFSGFGGGGLAQYIRRPRGLSWEFIRSFHVNINHKRNLR